MEKLQELAEAKLTNLAYTTPISQLEGLPTYIPIENVAVDVSTKRQHLLDLFSKLQTGTHIELIALYIQQMWDRLSVPVQRACKSLAGDKTAHFSHSDALADLFAEIESKRVTGDDYILGTTLATSTAITKSEVLTAAAVAVGAHPVRLYLNQVLKKYKSANALDLLDPDELFKLIDFPITSISNLLRCMAHSYITSTEYISEGILVGTTHEFVVVYAKANPKFYKVMKLETFEALFPAKMFDTPLTKTTAVNYGILEYHNGGQARG